MNKNINLEDLIKNINKMDHSTFNKINACNNVVMLGNFKLTFVGKGGDGNIYAIDKYALKFYKTNNNKFTNEGNPKEMFLLKRSSEIVNNNITNTFLKIYGFLKIFNHSVIIMDLVDGDLESWTNVFHNEHEWLSMIFQLLYATFIMQTYLKVYHHDMKPKNLLFKKLTVPQNIKYVIKNSNETFEFTMRITEIFYIADFGQASSLLWNKNVFIPETIILSMENNLDLEHLSVFHNRQAVTLLKNVYTTKDLIEIGKNDIGFKSYYDHHYKKIMKNMKGYPEHVIQSMLFRSLGYYIIEKKLINIDDIPNLNNDIFLPTKKIRNVLESLQELRGKGTLLNKIQEIGKLLNSSDLSPNIILKSDSNYNPQINKK